MQLTTPALVILIGPSSSGKSTWAAEHFEPNEVVSSDALRGVVGAGEDDQTAGTVAFEVLDRIVEERLRRRMTTVVDTLGFSDDARSRWEAWAGELPVHHVVFDTPRGVCEARNDSRERAIPKAVLRKQFTRFKEIRQSITEAVVVDTSDENVPAVDTSTAVRPVEPTVGHSFGLIVSRFDWDGQDLGPKLFDIARRAESVGFRDIWVMDHFRQIRGVGQKWEDIPEAYTALGYMAGATDRIRLGAMVSGITHRHPVVLGKMVASLDVLSGGRAICGLGIAWDEEEHRGYGIEFPPTSVRYEILEETLQMLPLLWGKGTPAFDGRHIQANELICYPRPVQDPIPIMIGGSGEKKTLRLVAEYGDASNLFGDPETIRHKVEVLERHCADFDRDPSGIQVTHLTTSLVGGNRRDLMARANELRDRNQTAEEYIERSRGGTVDQLVERFAAYDRAGATHSIVALPDVALEGSLETFGDVIAAMGET